MFPLVFEFMFPLVFEFMFPLEFMLPLPFMFPFEFMFPLPLVLVLVLVFPLVLPLPFMLPLPFWLPRTSRQPARQVSKACLQAAWLAFAPPRHSWYCRSQVCWHSPRWLCTPSVRGASTKAKASPNARIESMMFASLLSTSIPSLFTTAAARTTALNFRGSVG